MLCTYFKAGLRRKGLGAGTGGRRAYRLFVARLAFTAVSYELEVEVLVKELGQCWLGWPCVLKHLVYSRVVMRRSLGLQDPGANVAVRGIRSSGGSWFTKGCVRNSANPIIFDKDEVPFTNKTRKNLRKRVFLRTQSF